MEAGTRVVLRHAEELNEDGTLFTEPLRGAKQTDTYIAAGDERDWKSGCRSSPTMGSATWR